MFLAAPRSSEASNRAYARRQLGGVCMGLRAQLRRQVPMAKSETIDPWGRMDLRVQCLRWLYPTILGHDDMDGLVVI